MHELRKRVIELNKLIEESDKAWIKRDDSLQNDILAINNALKEEGFKYKVEI